eukprot:COSAG01_NODE_10860_length_2066_cov_3.117438_3_plen_74_part_00
MAGFTNAPLPRATVAQMEEFRTYKYQKNRKVARGIEAEGEESRRTNQSGKADQLDKRSIRAYAQCAPPVPAVP